MKYLNKGREHFIKLVKEKSFYERLGLNKDADTQTIKQNYRLLTLKWHPDMIGKLGPIFANKDRYQSFMSEIFQLYKESYTTLTNPSERKVYDTMSKVGAFKTANTYKK